MADFLTAVEKTLNYEGGLSDDPRDPGGLTNFGISLRAHPELTENGIRHMTRTEAIGIYRSIYWPDIYSSLLDQRLANCLFDFGVTSGVEVAVKTLQRVLGRIITGPVVADGIFGPQTLAMANAADPTRLLKEFGVARLQFYASLAKTEFLHSWFARTLDGIFN